MKNPNHRVIQVTFVPETNEEPSRIYLKEQRYQKKDKILVDWSSNTDLSNTILQAVYYLESIGINVVGYGNYDNKYFIFSDSWATSEGFKTIKNTLEN